MANGMQTVMGTGSHDFLPLYFHRPISAFRHFRFRYLSNTSRIAAFLTP
jgi:hypothetical protein